MHMSGISSILLPQLSFQLLLGNESCCTASSNEGLIALALQEGKCCCAQFVSQCQLRPDKAGQV